jgi:elongation factor P
VPLAKDLKRGQIVEMDDAPFAIEKIEVKSPSARGASTLYKIRARNLKTGNKVDKSFDGTVLVKDADFQRKPVQYLYNDGTEYHFMDEENASQFAFTTEVLGDQVQYLVENMPGLTYLVYNDAAIGIQLPPVIESEIVDTSPGIRGSSATGRTKPAKLATGLTVQVPEYLENGERVRVDTESGEYVGRAD